MILIWVYVYVLHIYYMYVCMFPQLPPIFYWVYLEYVRLEQRDRQTGRQADRQADRQTDRRTDGQRQWHRQRDNDMDRDRATETELYFLYSDYSKARDVHGDSSRDNTIKETAHLPTWQCSSLARAEEWEATRSSYLK